MTMKRSLSKMAMLSVSMGAMLGSGWLFGPFYAAQLAGPASILSWIIGGFLISFIAVTAAELSAMLPLTGGIARFPHFSHGSLTSYLMTWLAWIAYILLPPIEVQASLQYAANLLPWITQSVDGNTRLTGMGIGFAAALLFLMHYLNILGIHLVTRINIVVVWIKLGVPLITAILLFSFGFHAENFTDYGGFHPYGLHGVLSALPLAGIIFAYFGFRLPIELAGEAKNPQRSLPLALIGSIVLCTCLYTLLQTAFIAAEQPTALVQGWKGLNFIGDLGPFAGIATILGLGWLVSLLYFDAFLSPCGSAFMVITTNARLNYAMSLNGYFPRCMRDLNKKQVPHTAILINGLLGLILLLPFSGWQTMVSFIIAALVISHSITPITLMALRYQIPQQPRPFRLPAARLVSLMAFIVINWILYWTGWGTLWKSYIAILLGLLVLGLIRRTQSLEDRTPLDSFHALFLLPYFIGMAFFSYYGQFGGGRALLPFGLDMVYIALFSTLVFFLGLWSRLPAEKTQHYLHQAEGSW